MAFIGLVANELYIIWDCVVWGLPASGDGVAILPGPAPIAKV